MDERSGYQTRSLLTVPLINQHGEVIGVIQLLNKKSNPSDRLLTLEHFDTVISFTRRDEELCATLAAQAGISLENALLYEEIRHLFDGPR
jgi:GAF domain-containing protein